MGYFFGDSISSKDGEASRLYRWAKKLGEEAWVNGDFLSALEAWEAAGPEVSAKELFSRAQSLFEAKALLKKWREEQIEINKNLAVACGVVGGDYCLKEDCLPHKKSRELREEYLSKLCDVLGLRGSALISVLPLGTHNRQFSQKALRSAFLTCLKIARKKEEDEALTI